MTDNQKKLELEQKKRLKREKAERIREEAKNYVLKKTWHTDWMPALTNIFGFLSILFGVAMLFLPYANKGGAGLTITSDFSIVLLLAVVLPIVSLAVSFLQLKYNSIGLLVFGAFSLFSLAAFVCVPLLKGSISIYSIIAAFLFALSASFALTSSIRSIIVDIKNERNYIVSYKNFIKSYKNFGKGVYYWWHRHYKIAEFISYFMVGNFITIIQFIVLPLLQLIFKNTNLINIDFHFIGPIGGAQRVAKVLPDGVKIYDPYYVFNFTGGKVGEYVYREINGVAGMYLGHGGLAYFLAMFITLIIAQVLTFIMQRNVTFKSDGNIPRAVFWFVIATIVITIGQNVLYAFYQPWIYGLLGDSLGGVFASFLQALISFWVFFPIFKVIFPRSQDKKKKNNAANV